MRGTRAHLLEANAASVTDPAVTIPAVVRRHRRQKQLDWAIAFARDRWQLTPAGWRLSGTDFELHATGDKIRDHGYRIVRSGQHWASFASPMEAIAYVEWRAHQPDEASKAR